MRTALIYLLVIFFYSCGARKASFKKVDTSTFKENVTEMDSPRDFIIIPEPKKERPRGEKKVYTGENGAQGTIAYDAHGIIESVVLYCPPVKVRERTILDSSEKVKQREADRQEGVGWKGFIWSFITGFLVGIIIWMWKPWKNLFSWSRILDFFKK